MPGDQDALMRQLHDEHAAALWHYCLGLTGRDQARAEDVVQETLLRAWRNFSVLDESRGSVRGWLFTVARNIVIDESRTKRSRLEFPVSELPEVVDAGGHDDQLLQAWVVAEASRRLGVPEGTVKSRTHYALRALRLALQEMGVGA